MTKLHQILAIERGVTADSERKVALATRGIDVTGENSPLFGVSRVYQPRKEDGDTYPAESKHVQVKCETVLENVAKATTRLFDVKFTREESNTQARADVIVDGHLFLESVPAGYLLYLENALNSLRGLLQRMPVLDPAEEWHWDGKRGFHVTDQSRRAKEIRVPQAHVMYEATPEHPAQVRPYETVAAVGDWTTVKFSGALPADRLEEILDRVATLSQAVKMAREEANRIDVTDRKAGGIIFAYLLNGTM